jgi:hypothetical protein
LEYPARDTATKRLDDTDARASEVWPELEKLALPAREKRRLEPATRSRIICQRAPLSVKELSALLNRSEAYIGDAIRPLVNAGDLTFLYPDQPRHPRQKYLAASQNDHPAAPVAPEPVIPERVVHDRVTPDEVTSAPVTGGPLTPKPVAPVRKPPSPERLGPPTAASSDASSEDAPPPAPTGGRFPNQLTNLTVVFTTGILLALLDAPVWFLFAALAAVGLAAAHVHTNSLQFEQFHELQGFRRRRSLSFIVLKAGVSAAEIALVYYATSFIAG